MISSSNFKNWWNLNKELMFALGWYITHGKKFKISNLWVYGLASKFWFKFWPWATLNWINQWIWVLIKSLMKVIRETIIQGVTYDSSEINKWKNISMGGGRSGPADWFRPREVWFNSKPFSKLSLKSKAIQNLNLNNSCTVLNSKAHK
jgi:hypothetical protein